MIGQAPVRFPPPTKLWWLLASLILLSATVAGLQTVADFDLGWQMAESRTPFSSADTLSYTAAGAPWIYPPLAGLIFRAFFSVGGYAAISWFCAFALLSALAILVVRGSALLLLLVLLAVPVFAEQMIPRSGLFTVIFAVIYARLLITHLLHGPGNHHPEKTFWLLPVVMTLWVNLHTGFIAGLALMLGYLAAEIVEGLKQKSRPLVLRRMRQIAPWIALSFACTLVNPWGPRIYQAIAALEHPTHLQTSTILELAPLYRTFPWDGFRSIVSLDGIWWLLGLSYVAALLLLVQRRLGPALFLGLAILCCLGSARSQGVFLPVACLLVAAAFEPLVLAHSGSGRFRFAAVVLFVTSLVTYTGWRCFATVTGEHSLESGQITFFGAGPSWWLPQEAAAFIEQHALPPNLFSSFNLSSYLIWRLRPAYKDFADGRYLPFGDRLIAEQLRLAATPLDSEPWRHAAEQYGIRTIILPLSRFFGEPDLPLREDCASTHWAPVYLDAKAIVFVRADLTASNPSLHRVDCQTQMLVPDAPALISRRARLKHYQLLANAAVIYFRLGRNADAETAIERAQQIATADDSLLLLRGQIKAAQGQGESAEELFRRALNAHPSAEAWNQLGLLYAGEKRYADASAVLSRALSLSPQPRLDIELSLAKAQLLAGQLAPALQTLRHAEHAIPDEGPGGATARAAVFELEAVVQAQLPDWPAAIEAQQRALRQTPEVGRSWRTLAALYSAAGDGQKAAEAAQKAESLAAQQAAWQMAQQ